MQAAPVRLDQLPEEKGRQLEDLAAARPDPGRGGERHSTPDHVPGLADSLVANLLQNAVKYSLPSRAIRVTLTAQALEVANAGPAIAGDPAHFFERFRRHNAASGSPGLGLSIVQQIYQLYGFALEYSLSPVGDTHTLRMGFAATGQASLEPSLALQKNHIIR